MLPPALACYRRLCRRLHCRLHVRLHVRLHCRHGRSLAVGRLHRAREPHSLPAEAGLSTPELLCALRQGPLRASPPCLVRRSPRDGAPEAVHQGVHRGQRAGGPYCRHLRSPRDAAAHHAGGLDGQRRGPGRTGAWPSGNKGGRWLWSLCAAAGRTPSLVAWLATRACVAHSVASCLPHSLGSSRAGAAGLGRPCVCGS